MRCATILDVHRQKASGTFDELVQVEGLIERCGRGIQQQSEIDSEKSVWFS